MNAMNASNANKNEDQKIIDDMRLWLEQAVIGLNLCPFAKSVHVKNQIRYVVSEATELEAALEELLLELRHLRDTSPETTDTTLLILPHMFHDFYVFNDVLDLVDQVTDTDEFDDAFQVASFHPQFQFAHTKPDDIENYTNRAPYPVWHLIREASIDRAVASFPDAEAIYSRNIETLRTLGLAGWQQLFTQHPET